LYFIANSIMLLSVKVKPNARKNELSSLPDGSWVAAVTASPVDGKANAAVIRLLAEHFGLPKRSIIIESGLTSRQKRIRIEGMPENR
jgi:uncharacterized protein (TIGR00251 family)